MSDTKFAPGPWVAVESLEVEDFFSIRAPIGDIAYLTLERDVLRGNAHLIAAAPELYEALQGFIDHCVEMINSGDCGHWNPEKDECVVNARAALKKARGES